jgi:quinol monooxygenase YgiN
MQMCKGWLASSQLQAGCLARRVYEDATLPTDLLLVEEWLDDTDAMHAYLSSEGFRALIGAMKVLGTLVDIRTFNATLIESGRVASDRI